MARRLQPTIPDAIIDELLAGADTKTIFDPNGLLDGLKKAFAERILNAGMDHHLDDEEAGADNSRNGYGTKTVTTDTGSIELKVPRDRQSSFEPHLISKYQRRFPGFDDKIISIVDGLKGFPEAITAVFPEATVQTCIVHLIRHSLDFVPYKDRKAVAAALKEIYRAIDAWDGEAKLSDFEASEWGRKYPAIGQSWRRAWTEVIPFFAFPAEVRRILYATNAIEALNSKLRRAVRARGHFPSDEAATKLLFLVLNRSGKEWKMPQREWAMAKAQFAVQFGERFIRAMVRAAVQN